MKKNKLFNFFKLIIIMLVAVSLLVCSLEAFDSHIDHCMEEHCSHCEAIINAQNIMNIAGAICIFIAFICVSYCLVSKIHIVLNFIREISLVRLSVQFNE